MMGMYKEAADEIESIPDERRNHQSVLHIACRAYWGLRQIPKAMAYTERFIQVAPHEAFGYVFKAMLLSYMHKPRESYELLKPVVARFPTHAIMHYDLAGAAVKCGLFSEARRWLYHAICIRGSLKKVALKNPAFMEIKSDIEAMNQEN